MIDTLPKKCTERTIDYSDEIKFVFEPSKIHSWANMYILLINVYHIELRKLSEYPDHVMCWTLVTTCDNMT